MVGPALKVTPKLSPGNDPIDSYFPVDSCFIDLYDYSKVIDSNGKVVKLDVSDDHVNTHLRAGYILPWQPRANSEAWTTVDLI